MSLFQVDWVDVAQSKVNLRIVPRIDYTRMRGALRTVCYRYHKCSKATFTIFNVRKRIVTIK